MSFAQTFAFSGPGGPYRDATGALQQAMVNAPRFDHSAAGAPLGLLVQAPPSLGAPEEPTLLAGIVPNQAVTVLHQYTQTDGTPVAQAVWTLRPGEAVAQLLGLQGWHQSLIVVARALLVTNGQVVFRGVTYDVAGGLVVPMRPETKLWQLRCPVQPTAWYARLVNQLVVIPLVASGAWPLLDCLKLLNGDPGLGAAGMATSLVDLTGRTPSLVAVNAPVATPGFGWAGDGVSSYLASNVNLSTYGGQYAENSASAFMWQTTDIPGATALVGASAPGSRMSLRGRNGLSANVYANDEGAGLLSTPTGAGFLGFSRQGAASYIAGKGGIYDAFFTQATGLPGLLNIGRFGNGSTYDPNQCAAVGFGAGLSEAQLDSVYSALLNLLIAIGTITSDSQPTAITYGYGCFSQAQLANVTPAGLKVSMNIGPPPDMTYTAANCPYFPASIFTSQQIDQIVASTRTDCAGQHYIWGFREIEPSSGTTYPNQKPNPGAVTIYSPTAKKECRYTYSLRNKARKAWLIQQMYSAGALPRGDARYPNGHGWLDVADAAGYNTAGWSSVTGAALTTDVAVDTGGSAGAGNAIVHLAQIAANPDSYFQGVSGGYMVATDLVYLPKARLCDATMPTAGFLRDTEDQTSLGSAELLSTMQEAAASCHATNQQLTAFNNPLNGGGALATGFSGAINPATGNSFNYDIAEAADFICIVAYPGNPEKSVSASLANQVATFSPAVPWAKIIMLVGIGAPGQEMSVSDAQYVHDFIVEYGVTHVQFWRDYATQGGDLSRPVNQVIATVLGLPTVAVGGVFDSSTFDSGAVFG